MVVWWHRTRFSKIPIFSALFTHWGCVISFKPLKGSTAKLFDGYNMRCDVVFLEKEREIAPNWLVDIQCT